MKIIRTIPAVVCSICIFILITFSGSSGKENLQIGWASVNITPSKPVPLRGQMHKRISEYVRDSLYATALALEKKSDDGTTAQAIMITIDLCGVSKATQNSVKEIVKSKIPDFDAKKLFINATHTHTAPSPEKTDWYDTSKDTGIMTEDEFGVFLAERIAEAAVQAWSNRKPGGVSYKLGRAVVGHNRRVEYFDGNTAMYGRTDTDNYKGPEGGSDSGVEMLFCWDINDELTGVVINLACPSQVVEGKTFISADFWGEVRKALKKKYSDGIFVLPQCSAAGDQSPRDLSRRRRGEPNMSEEEGLVEMAKRIVNAVDDAIPYARKSIKKDVVFKHSVTAVMLPVRRVGFKEYIAAFEAYSLYEKLKAAALETGNKEFYDKQFPVGLANDFVMSIYKKKSIIERYRTQEKEPYFAYELHALRLGDIAFATNPFELFLEYGLRMKARSEAEQTFVIQLCGDEAGYLPTDRAVAGEGYSAYIYNGEVGPEGGKVLVDETVRLINNMWK